MKSIKELESEALKLEREAQRFRFHAMRKRQEIKRQRKQEIEEESGVEVALNDDYAVLDTNDYEFYFGYEVTECSRHDDKRECYENDCEEQEWCFLARKKESNDVLLKVPASKLSPLESEEPAYFLLQGIGRFLNG